MRTSQTPFEVPGHHANLLLVCTVAVIPRAEMELVTREQTVLRAKQQKEAEGFARQRAIADSMAAEAAAVKAAADAAAAKAALEKAAAEEAVSELPSQSRLAHTRSTCCRCAHSMLTCRGYAVV